MDIEGDWFFNCKGDQQKVEQLITGRTTNVNGQATIKRVEEAAFFGWHDNQFEGYFVWVCYPTGIWEIYFVVDLRSSVSDNQWHVEKIT